MSTLRSADEVRPASSAPRHDADIVPIAETIIEAKTKGLANRPR
jgi:hypothetical protein